MAFFNSGGVSINTDTANVYNAEQFCLEQETLAGVSNVNDDGPGIAVFVSAVIAMVWWLV